MIQEQSKSNGTIHDPHDAISTIIKFNYLAINEEIVTFSRQPQYEL